MTRETSALDLSRWIRDGDCGAIAQAFQGRHPADAARLLAELTPQEVARYVELAGPSESLTVFEFVPFELQKESIQHLSRDARVGIISLMSPDDRVDLVEELDEAFRDRLLSRLMQAEKQNILNLMTYPEDSAGAHMTTDYAMLRSGATIRDALDQLRLQAPKKETIYYVYVVDQGRHLIGFLSLRDLIMAPSDKLVGEVMRRKVISVHVHEDIEDVAKEMTHYDFLAMPVVDGEERLVGIITYDDIFDVMEEEATEDMYRLANLDTEEKISSPLHRSVKLRAPWLMINICTAILVAYSVHMFSSTIEQFVALAALMPIVAMLGGNAGNQSLTVVVRALALGEITDQSNWRVMLKELGVGASNGLICGLVIGGVSFLWYGNLWLALILWIAMIGNLLLAGFCGALVPITLRKLKLDPALGSSIFVTTATDVGGFIIFLGLATLLLRFLVG